MQYTVLRGERGKIEIKVDVPQATFDEAYRQVLDKHAREAKIAGFRPGKAPLDIVEGHVGSNKVLNETANILVSKHLGDILKKEDLTPIDSPKLAYDSFAKGSPFSFTVTFTQLPKVTVGDWKKIKIAKVKVQTIEEKDIGESIKNIFEAWKKKESQRVKESKSESEDEEKEGDANKPSFAKASEGQGKFIYDAQGNKIFIDDKRQETRDKKQDIKEPSDEWAKLVGAQSMAHLKEFIKKDLEALVADQAEVKYEANVFEKLREISAVEVPDVLVDDEVNRMLVNLASELERQGKELKNWLEEQKTTLDAIKSKWRDAAQRNVVTNLIVNQIGKDEKVQVTKEEIDAAMSKMSEKNLSVEQKGDLERYIAFNIFQAKTLDLIKKTIANA